MHGFERCVAHHAKANVGGTHIMLSALVSNSDRCYNGLGQTQTNSGDCPIRISNNKCLPVSSPVQWYTGKL